MSWVLCFTHDLVIADDELGFVDCWHSYGRIMNGINAPKVIECFGSDGNKYRQLAKSGNDDLRQDAVCSSLSFLIMRFLQYVFGIKIILAYLINDVLLDSHTNQ